jgi:cell division protein FtsQ
MLKKIKWKLVGAIFLWLVSLSGLVVLMSFIETKKVETVCREVKVILPGNQYFIERAEVDEILVSKNGLLVGRRLDNIDLQSLEDRLQANPFIEYANVFADMNGVIHANIRQRVPILRMLNIAGQDYYIDQNGLKIPLSEHFTARVLVANGMILEGFSGKIDTLRTTLAKDLFKVAVHIAKDSLWNEQFVQLYVNDKKEIELVPRVGKQKIIFGDGNDIEDKFKRLLVFYKKAIPYVGWDTYSSVSLKFKGQIVCQKSDSTILKTQFEQQQLRDSLRKEEIKEIAKDSIQNTL